MLPHTPLELSHKRTQIIIWTLLCFVPVSGMAIDLIAPSLPAIASSLHVSNSIAKNIIAIYILGYGLGNFSTGFLVDAWGRKKIIRIGWLGFMVVSLIPVFSHNITVLLLARLLQGITLGIVAVSVKSIVSDVLAPEQLIRVAPLIGMMWGVGPIIGPVLGGYLQMYLGWTAGFYFLSLIALVAFVTVFFVIPETHHHGHPLKIKTIKKNLMEVLSHRLFMGLVMLMGLIYSIPIMFNAAGPFLIQFHWHYSPVFFGHLALWLGVVFLVGIVACRYLLKIYRPEQLLSIVIYFLIFIAPLFVIISYFFSRSITLVVIASACFFLGDSFISPLAVGKGFTLFRHIAGTASATMYLINTMIASLISFLISFINVHSAVQLMWIYFFLIAVSTVVYWLMVRPSANVDTA